MKEKFLFVSSIEVEEVPDRTVFYEHFSELNYSLTNGPSDFVNMDGKQEVYELRTFMRAGTDEVIHIAWTNEVGEAFGMPMEAVSNMSDENYKQHEEINKLIRKNNKQNKKINMLNLEIDGHNIWFDEMQASWWERLKFLFKRQEKK